VDVSGIADPRWSARACSDCPQLAGTQVAEYSSFAAGEHGRHPPAFMAESGVANGINTTMNRVEATSLCALRDPAS
jgi:hypothetical protein